MSKLISIAIILGLSVLFFTGSSAQETSVTGDTLIFGRGGDSIHLDPIQPLDGESTKVCKILYDTLVQYRDDTTKIEPALAKAWERSTDGLTWTFH